MVQAFACSGASTSIFGSARRAYSFFETAADLLDYPQGIELKQDGYLVLAHSPKSLASLKAAMEAQHRLGVPSELLSAEDCVRMVPSLGRDRLVGGTSAERTGAPRRSGS